MNEEQLVRDNISFLKDYLPKLYSALEKISELLTLKLENEALQLLTQVLESFGWIITSIKSLERLNYLKDLEIDNLNECLQEMERALQIQDYVLAMDIIQYEIMEIINRWNKKVVVIGGDHH